MPPKIVSLAKDILGNPERITIKPEQATAERVEQGVYFVNKSNKTKLLIHLIKEKQAKSLLVFTRTKHGANRVVKKLESAGIHSAAIHGNKSQSARQKALKNFKAGTIQVLIATDIAARGIDVDQLELVINFELPNVPETYVHRIGRTGRAQASGTALSFCDEEEKAYLKDIQKLIKQTVPVFEDHPFVNDISSELDTAKLPQRKKPQRGSKSGQGKSASSGRSNRSNNNSRRSNAPSGKSKSNRASSRRKSSSSSSGQRKSNHANEKKGRLF